MSEVVVVLLCVVAGLAVGPMLTELIIEVPDRHPVSWPSLRQHPPVLYWLRPAAEGVERGLTRAWGVGVEVGAPVLFALAGLRWGASWVVVPYLVLFAALLVVSVIDIEHYRIPDRIVLPALAISIPLITIVSIVEGSPRAVVMALVGAAFYSFMLFVAFMVYPAGMGFGDVKLALLMGLFLGWMYLDLRLVITLVLFALMIGCVLGALVGGVLLIVRRRSAEFPFGPALALSTLIAILFSNQILHLS